MNRRGVAEVAHRIIGTRGNVVESKKIWCRKQAEKFDGGQKIDVFSLISRHT